MHNAHALVSREPDAIADALLNRLQRRWVGILPTSEADDQVVGASSARLPGSVAVGADRQTRQMTAAQIVQLDNCGIEKGERSQAIELPN
ncbi:MAG: hypothetical protein ACXWC4_03815 [Telluria sp.]